MYKWPVTYTDYNGIERTESFYFNLSKAELMEMELSTTGGLAEMLRGIIEARDVPSLSKFFRDIVMKAYGVKSPDGRLFRKNATLCEEFSQTEAFSIILMALYSDAEFAAEFINKIIPPDLAEQAAQSQKNLVGINATN